MARAQVRGPAPSGRVISASSYTGSVHAVSVPTTNATRSGSPACSCSRAARSRALSSGPRKVIAPGIASSARAPRASSRRLVGDVSVGFDPHAVLVRLDRRQGSLPEPETSVCAQLPERESLRGGEAERLGYRDRPVHELVAVREQRDRQPVAGETLHRKRGFERSGATAGDEERHAATVSRMRAPAIRASEGLNCGFSTCATRACCGRHARRQHRDWTTCPPTS